MRKIFEYLRLILFVGGVLIGVQVPAFVDQYGKHLDAHWQESQLGLKAFQRDADKYFGGDLARLIKHYRASEDPVVNDGGVSINTLYERNVQLADAHARFNENVISPYYQTLLHPILEIRNNTWSDYNFTIVLDAFAIAWGLLIGLLFAVIVELCLGLLGLILVRPFRRPRRRRRV